MPKWTLRRAVPRLFRRHSTKWCCLYRGKHGAMQYHPPFLMEDPTPPSFSGATRAAASPRGASPSPRSPRSRGA